MSASRVWLSGCLVVGLLACTASANVVIDNIDNFEEGSVDIQAGPFSADDDPARGWVESVETGLSPVNTVAGRRRTSVYGEYGDWTSARLTGGAMHFTLDNDLTDAARLHYDDLGGLALPGSGIAFDIDYGSRDLMSWCAAFVELALYDTAGRSGSMRIMAGQGIEDYAVSGTHEFVFDDQIRQSVDLTSINSIELSFTSNYAGELIDIDNIRRVPDPATLSLLALAGAGLVARRR